MLNGFLVTVATSVNNTKKLFFARQETHGISGLVDRKDSGRLE